MSANGEKGVTFKLVPTNQHRHSATEHSIHAFKNQFRASFMFYLERLEHTAASIRIECYKNSQNFRSHAFVLRSTHLLRNLRT